MVNVIDIIMGIMKSSKDGTGKAASCPVKFFCPIASVTEEEGKQTPATSIIAAFFLGCSYTLCCYQPMSTQTNNNINNVNNVNKYEAVSNVELGNVKF